VLPVPTSEIIEAFRKEKAKHIVTTVRYIIIDCRSLKSFRFARLPTAVHIGQHVGYDAERMQKILARFVDAKGSHFSIFGTGRELQEEDNLLKMMAMKFVAAGFEHISIARGGFAECIKYISNNEIEFVRDIDPRQQQQMHQEVKATEKIAETVNSLWNWGKKGIFDFSYLTQIVAEEYINEAEKKVATIQQLREELANQSDAPKYTLDDDSDEEIETSARIAEVKIVKIEELRNICKIYSAKLETTTGPVPRFIAVGANMILCLKSHPTCTCFFIC
jgi:hypothetical protein